jgi:ABC-type sugar transport system permease subunit
VQTVIFIASLQSISGSLYEVAKIEGATVYETFWKVTFPMVSPLILTNVVYTIVDSFMTSAVVKKAEQMAFTNFEYGISSAMSLISTVAVCLILVVLGYILSKRTYYYN